jgi:hypothetical protein
MPTIMEARDPRFKLLPASSASSDLNTSHKRRGANACSDQSCDSSAAWTKYQPIDGRKWQSWRRWSFRCAPLTN